MGHLLLIGESGTGKSANPFRELDEFVVYIRDKAESAIHRANFDDDLRHVMKRAGVDGRACFLFDDTDSLSSASLEKMNALWPVESTGLFEDRDQMATSWQPAGMPQSAGVRTWEVETTSQPGTAYSASSTDSGSAMDTSSSNVSDDELFRMFTCCTEESSCGIHNESAGSHDWKERCTVSPALFNRCVVN